MNRFIAERLTRRRLHESMRSSRDYLEPVEDILNHQLSSYETRAKVEDMQVISETPDTVTLRVEYSVDVKIPMADEEDGSIYYEYDTEYRSRIMTLEPSDLNEDASSEDEMIKRMSDEDLKYEIRDIKDKLATAEMYGRESAIQRFSDELSRYQRELKSRKGMREDMTIDDDPEETEQKYSSAATSINSSKLPALFKMVKFEEDSINLDYGGGRFDNVAEYLMSEYGATNLVYDKYNRSADHNREVLNKVRQNGGADTVTCSNVLNVIAEESERLAVLRNCKRYLKAGGTCYITVYEGDGSGEGAPTKSGYQLNRKTKDYESEIKQVFPGATRKGKLFICK